MLDAYLIMRICKEIAEEIGDMRHRACRHEFRRSSGLASHRCIDFYAIEVSTASDH
jgi:hypothetical protein